MAEDERELFRYRKGDQVRVYSLRGMGGSVELWRSTSNAGLEPVSIKEADVGTSTEAVQLCAEIQRSLIAGGWQETPGNG